MSGDDVRACLGPGCGGPMPAGSRADRETCSSACRQRLHRARAKGSEPAAVAPQQPAERLGDADLLAWVLSLEADLGIELKPWQRRVIAESLAGWIGAADA